MDDSARRYERQERLPQIGAEGQQALARATVAVVGLGALGSVGADLLARAGVGRLLLVDRDVVEWANLQRQVLYGEADAAAARPKCDAAVERLRAVNGEVALTSHAVDLTAANAAAVLEDADVLLDGTDNFATRYLLNDFAVARGVPYVYAGVVATYGMVGVVRAGGPCLRCLWPEAPAPEDTPTCRSAGVLGPAVAVVAGFAAAEALKLASGRGEEVLEGFRYVDAWHGTDRRIRAARAEDCPCCGARDFAWLEGRRGGRSAEPVCGGGAVQVPGAFAAGADLGPLADKLAGTVEGLQRHAGFLRYSVRELDVLLFPDGRALVRGTEDPGRARAALAETVGA